MAHIATLKDLLTDNELSKFRSIIHIDECTIASSINSVGLMNLSLVLIQTELKGKVPDCFLPAKALEILMTRASEKNIPFFE